MTSGYNQASTRSDPPPSSDDNQLALPLDGISRQRQRRTLPRTQRIFANRSLRMSEVEWIGFDMDYTLAVYVQHEMDRLQIACTLPKLVERGYPEKILQCNYDIDFPVRGLLVDKKRGNALKVDLHRVVRRGRHGTREMSAQELHSVYNQHKLKMQNDRFQWVDTLYAVTEVTMYCTIIDQLENDGLTVDYEKLFKDIRECIDGVHADGTVGGQAMKDFSRYVVKDPKLAETLHRWRVAGKRLFLLTNSHWPYSDAMMTYLLGDGLREYPSWRDYFDCIVVSARKPGFFVGEAPLKVREGDHSVVADGPLDRDSIYEGGNLNTFQSLLGVPGDKVLYIGDHIYGDVVRSKRESAWRTVFVMQELSSEIHAYLASEADFERLDDLDDLRRRTAEEMVAWNAFLVELSLVSLSSDLAQQLKRPSVIPSVGPVSRVPMSLRLDRIHSPNEVELERQRLQRNVERCAVEIKRLDDEIVELESRIDAKFHPIWGPILRERGELTSFSAQVDEYACLYTARVSNFLTYGALHHFTSNRDRMPHEL